MTIGMRERRRRRHPRAMLLHLLALLALTLFATCAVHSASPLSIDESSLAPLLSTRSHHHPRLDTKITSTAPTNTTATASPPLTPPPPPPPQSTRWLILFRSYRSQSHWLRWLHTLVHTSLAHTSHSSPSSACSQCTHLGLDRPHRSSLSPSVPPSTPFLYTSSVATATTADSNDNDHVVTLHCAHTSTPTRYRLEHRVNPATRHFPTDFALLHIESPLSPDDQLALDPILSALRHRPRVRSIQRDHMHRSLLAQSESAPPARHDLTHDLSHIDPGAPIRRFHMRLSVDATGDLVDAYSPDANVASNATTSTSSSTTTATTYRRRRQLLDDGAASRPSSSDSITGHFSAKSLWDAGHTGTGIRVAVFDTGLASSHPHFRHVEERTDWTDEHSLDDGIGHGSFVAGVIASAHSECAGFAPDAELFIFRVFNLRQSSFTSWFLDAFNYALKRRVHVLNLSIGGPDFLDAPFVEKVLELSANNVIVVSAIGNDGPIYGTLNNPADQMDVIGVGGVDHVDAISSFSSRGMTTWELPAGYGRVKPDIVAPSKGIRGSHITMGCRSLSGTSVASPVVAGIVTLLASTVAPANRSTTLNPARLKQALAATAQRLPDANMFEQGMGKVDLLRAHEHLRTREPHASVLPPAIDLVTCPYAWPFCDTDLYHSALPVVLNLTLLNSMSVTGRIVDVPTWVPEDDNSDVLALHFSYPDVIWPWSGYFAVSIQVRTPVTTSRTVRGHIQFVVHGERAQRSRIDIPLEARVIPTPPRSQRILWDQFHNLRYPSGFFPRDDLNHNADSLDWNGDHPHLNFRDVALYMRSKGYHLEILGQDFTCFDASLYSTLLIVDAEEEYFPEEVAKLNEDVRVHGLHVIVFADWYNTEVMQRLSFFDETTSSWWNAETGGANVPALNDLLSPFGIAFGPHVVTGQIGIAGDSVTYASGTTLVRFPARGYLYRAPLSLVSPAVVSDGTKIGGAGNAGGGGGRGDAGTGGGAYPVLGLLPSVEDGAGRLALFGDSNCLDMKARTTPPCTGLLTMLMEFVQRGTVDASVFPESSQLREPWADPSVPNLPTRSPNSNLVRLSKVLRPLATPQCSTRATTTATTTTATTTTTPASSTDSDAQINLERMRRSSPDALGVHMNRMPAQRNLGPLMIETEEGGVEKVDAAMSQRPGDTVHSSLHSALDDRAESATTASADTAVLTTLLIVLIAGLLCFALLVALVLLSAARASNSSYSSGSSSSSSSGSSSTCLVRLARHPRLLRLQLALAPIARHWLYPHASQRRSPAASPVPSPTSSTSAPAGGSAAAAGPTAMLV